MPRLHPSVLSDLRRSGLEPLGSPLRAVAVLARDVGETLTAGEEPLAARRRHAAAARVARAALSFAALLHGAFGDRPDGWRAYERSLGTLEERRARSAAESEGCVGPLARIASLVLLLPALPEGEDWHASAIAFADEGMLIELHGACLELAGAAVAVASSGVSATRRGKT